MRYLWNMLNKEFTIEGAVSAFLVINMIGWMAATMGAGMLICKFLGFSITGNLENLMCAGMILAAVPAWNLPTVIRQALEGSASRAITDCRAR